MNAVTSSDTHELPDREGCQDQPDTGKRKRPPTPHSENWVENGPYNDFVRRAIKSAGKRIGNHGVEDLAEVLRLEGELEAAIQAGVDRLREMGYSWDDIARAAGMKRQSAWERWGPCKR
jgi:hypothetical protein